MQHDGDLEISMRQNRSGALGIVVAIVLVLLLCEFACPAAALADLQVGQADLAGQVSQADQASQAGQVASSQKAVQAKSIRKAKIEKIRPLAFSGKAKRPDPLVTFAGKRLKRGRDYVVRYANNVYPGKARLTIKGKGAYAGEKTKTFAIRPKYVMVGDSYAHSGSPSWPTATARKLGLHRDEYRRLARSGCGFALGRTNFLDLIRGARRDSSVSDVLIVGGCGNDIQRHRSREQVEVGYRATMRAIRKVYPNARILHAVPNWHHGHAYYRATMVKRTPFIKALARKYGVVYLSDCDKVLRKDRSMTGGDGNHPSQAGAYAIAKAAAKQIAKTPYASPSHPHRRAK